MIFLDKEQIFACSSTVDLVDALQAAFAMPATTPERMHCSLPGDAGGTLLIMPAWQTQALLGVKIVTVLPGNPLKGLSSINGIHVLIDGETGAVKAVLDASALTALRTAAVSALASRLLSRADATSLLMVGTGALAEHLIRAHSSVRPIDRVTIWGRDAGKAEALIERLGDLNVELTVARDIASAVAAADIVSCATMSDRPLVISIWSAVSRQP